MLLRRHLAWVIACARIACEACHILRTDKKIGSAVPIDYAERVNRAIDHIVRNLAEPLSLEAVSEAAGFSPFHFHRVFKSLLGETLNRFVKRLRRQAGAVPDVRRTQSLADGRGLELRLFFVVRLFAQL